MTLFTIAGAGENFVQARAVIEGDTAVVSSDKVKNPVDVRFSWSNDGVGNFINKKGLPVSLFRKDDWK